MIDINQFRADHLIKIPLGFLGLIKVNLLYAFHHSPFLSLPFIIFVFAFLIFLYIFRKLWNIKSLLQREAVFLELTPPAFTEKTAYTTQQLFSVLHNIGMQQTFLDKLIGRKVIYSFEIVSTKEEGIIYIIRTTPEEAQIIERTAISYLPQVRVKRIDEYLPAKSSFTKGKIIEFNLRKHFAFPLAAQNVLTQHDPVAYITGMMTKLKTSELIAFQIIVSPTKRKEAEILTQKILRNEDILDYLNKPHIPLSIQPIIILFKIIVKIIHVVTKELGWALTEIYHGSSTQQNYAYSHMQQQNQLIEQRIRPARILSSFEQETVLSIQKKIDQEMFETTIRAFIMVDSKKDQKERARGIKSSLAPFSVPKYQSLYPKYNFPPLLIDKIRSFTFKNRLLSIFDNKSSSLLSVSEIADLYHFPYTETTRTEDLVKNLSPELSAPLSLKQGTDLDVIFGENTFGNSSVPIGLTDDERSRHVYMIGQTGSGKSTVLFHMAKDDIERGRGLCVVDPHGDLVDDLRTVIPEDRINDVVYVNPFDIKYPININLIELTPGLDEDEQELEKELVAESVISIFRRIFFSDENIDAHRIEYILRNTIYTAFYVKDATIFTIYKLLTNPEYHIKILNDVEDENLRDFWKNEFEKAGDWQQFKMISGVTAKVGRFLYSPIAKRMLEKPKSTIYIDDLLNQSKIILCNLSEGKIGEDTAHLIGTTIITKIHLAILKRARMEKALRKPFYLYVDEFQNFATSSFTRLLSEGRKFGLRVTIAEQSTTQQEDRRIVNVILANVGTVMSFRTASPVDEELMLSEFYPLVKKGNILNLPRFHFYIKLGSIEPQEPFSGVTLPPNLVRDTKKVERVIEASRKNYATVYVKPEKEKKSVRKIRKKTKEKVDKKPKKVKKTRNLTG